MSTTSTVKNFAGDSLLLTLGQDAKLLRWMGLFHRATGLAIRLVPRDLDMAKGPACGHEHSFCCDSGLKGSSVCCETRDVLRKKLQTKLIPQRVVCGTGLTEVAVPVVVDGKHVTTFLVGQAFDQRPDAKSWARLESLLTDEAEKKRLTKLRKAYLRGQVLPEEILKTLVHMVSLHARRLVSDLRPPARRPRAKKTLARLPLLEGDFSFFRGVEWRIP
jgi:ligand-binding sensor protein